MITAESKRSLDTAVDNLKSDGYTVLVIMFDRKDDQKNAEVLSSETNDPRLLRAALKATFERFFPPDSSGTPIGDRAPVQEWEVSAWAEPDGTWKRFAPGQEPRRLTSISVECTHGACDQCQGIFSREGHPSRLVMCVHECHLAQHHDSYIPRP
jgi:hypothetical protein